MPTYNNERSLGIVLKDLEHYTHNIVVVNDGSTDSTKAILAADPYITVEHFKKNCGKGIALKRAFKVAQELGYDYAISIDSDGQHYADDLEIFLSELENKAPEEEILLVGDRNMGSGNVPGKSSTGNKFSNFWYMVVTGSELHDTQSGYRLYPLKIVNDISLYTWKFELEIEVIVKASWRKVNVKNVPIKVYYDKENRVTHFRPFWDITRIVLLYMWFVLVSFFYIHPQNKYKDFKEKGIKRFWKEDILKSQESPSKKAAAIALGIFVGISPFWGLHTMLVFLLAAVFKLNKVSAFVFSNISIPPFIPIIIYLSYQLGSLISGKGISLDLDISQIDSAAAIYQGLRQYIIGSLCLAVIASLLTWVVFYLLFSVSNQKQVVEP